MEDVKLDVTMSLIAQVSYLDQAINLAYRVGIPERTVLGIVSNFRV